MNDYDLEVDLVDEYLNDEGLSHDLIFVDTLREDSLKRLTRRQQKKNHIKKQAGLRSLYVCAESDPYHDQPHRYHKTKSLNCGDPNCMLCGNPRKFFGALTIQERKFNEIDVHVELMETG